MLYRVLVNTKVLKQTLYSTLAQPDDFLDDRYIRDPSTNRERSRLLQQKGSRIKKATRSAASALFLPRLAYVCPNVTKYQDDQFYICRKLHIFAYIHILLRLVLANIFGY